MMKKQSGLDPIIEFLIEETLEEEIAPGDTSNAEHVRAIFEKSVQTVAKNRLRVAAAAVEKRKGQPVVSLADRKAALAQVERMLANPANGDGFLLAAREGRALSDRDKEGLASDLEELRRLEGDS